MRAWIVRTSLGLRQVMPADRRAVTALEYGLIAALIAGVMITVVAGIGTDFKAMYTSFGDTLTAANAKF